jgi:hypothetical protein
VLAAPQMSLARLQAPAQHDCPVPPQGAHLPADPQVKPPPHGVGPAQQGSPLAPQVTQLVPEQTVPAAVHALPAQQGCATPPHSAQVAPEQIVPAAEQTLPAQHG